MVGIEKERQSVWKRWGEEKGKGGIRVCDLGRGGVRGCSGQGQVEVVGLCFLYLLLYCNLTSNASSWSEVLVCRK